MNFPFKNFEEFWEHCRSSPCDLCCLVNGCSYGQQVINKTTTHDLNSLEVYRQLSRKAKLAKLLS